MKIIKIAAICFDDVFCLLFFEIVKNLKMFDRQSLVNVTLEIRTEFHSNRLVRFRDILHTVSRNLVSSETHLKFQNVTFHMYPLLTVFASHSSYNSQLN